MDLATYKLQDQQKDLTETKLRSDVLVSTNNGLVTEKAHLVTELRETRDLYTTYEQKCTDLMKELHLINSTFQELKRANISHDENLKQRDDKIETLKSDLSSLNTKYEDMDLEFGSLKIQYEKEKEQLALTQKELEDTVHKLHITNKVRHETEVKLGEGHEKMKD